MLKLSPITKINEMFVPSAVKNHPNTALRSIDYITIHTTDNYNVTATAKAHANYLFGGSSGKTVSWHYSVDDKEIWRSFGDKQACWHAGNSIGNNTSIGIEICVNNRSVFRQGCVNAAWLTASLLTKYKLGFDRCVQHNFWSAKNCPETLRSGMWGVTWTDFTAMVNTFLHDGYRSSKITDVRQAIHKLAENGIISSPEYWINNHGRLQYLDLLIINMANKI